MMKRVPIFVDGVQVGVGHQTVTDGGILVEFIDPITVKSGEIIQVPFEREPEMEDITRIIASRDGFKEYVSTLGVRVLARQFTFEKFKCVSDTGTRTGSTGDYVVVYQNQTKGICSQGSFEAKYRLVPFNADSLRPEDFDSYVHHCGDHRNALKMKTDFTFTEDRFVRDGRKGQYLLELHGMKWLLDEGDFHKLYSPVVVADDVTDDAVTQRKIESISHRTDGTVTVVVKTVYQFTAEEFASSLGMKALLK